MFAFEVTHKHVGEGGGCTSNLEVVFSIKLEIVEFKDHLEEGDDSLIGWFSYWDLCRRAVFGKPVSYRPSPVLIRDVGVK